MNSLGTRSEAGEIEGSWAVGSGCAPAPPGLQVRSTTGFLKATFSKDTENGEFLGYIVFSDLLL